MRAVWNRCRLLNLESFGKRFLAGACAWFVLGLLSARPLRAQAPNTVTGTAGFETVLQLLTSGTPAPYYASASGSGVNVDWGDGSSSQGPVKDSISSIVINTYSIWGTHLYEQPGEYTITMTFQYCAHPVLTLDCTISSSIVPNNGFATAVDYSSATISPPGKFVILSIGDSVASGEGDPKVPNVEAPSTGSGAPAGFNYPSWSFWDDAYSNGDSPDYPESQTQQYLCSSISLFPGTCFIPVFPLVCPSGDANNGVCTLTTQVVGPFPPDVQAEWPNQSFPCHRSSYAGPAQAANELIADNPSSDITFIHFACSGATIQQGDTASTWKEDAVGQLKVARERLAKFGDGIDILLISAGANDVYGPTTFGNGYGGLVTYCLNLNPADLHASCDVNNAMQSELDNSLSNLPRSYENLAMEINCQQPPPFNGVATPVHPSTTYTDPDPGCTDLQRQIPKLVLITEYMDPSHDENGNYPSGLLGRAECGPAFQNLDYAGGGDFKFFHDGVVVPLNDGVDSFPTYAQQAGLNVPVYAVTGIADDFLGHGVCAGDQRWVDSGNDSIQLLGIGPPPNGTYPGQSVDLTIPALSSLGIGSVSIFDSEQLNGMLHPNSTILATTLPSQRLLPGNILCNPYCGQEDYRDRIFSAVVHDDPPVTTASATVAGSAYTFGTWTNQAVQITLSASNPISQSGVGDTYYGVDNPACSPAQTGGCSFYSGPFTISSSGLHTLTFFSENAYGNPEEMHTAQAWINLSAPSQPSGPGVNLVALLSSLTYDSQADQYVATVNIENTGQTTATGVTVTSASLNRSPASNIAPGTLPNITFGASFPVTLKFPAAAGAQGTRGVLTVSESFAGGTSGGGFRVTLP